MNNQHEWNIETNIPANRVITDEEILLLHEVLPRDILVLVFQDNDFDEVAA